MSDKVEMSADGMVGISKHLRHGGQQLEDEASSLPDVPDAGPCTDGVAAVLAWFTDSASRPVGGSMTSGDSVVESLRAYDQADTGNAESLHALGRW